MIQPQSPVSVFILLSTFLTVASSMDDSEDFIRSSCKGTLYPDLCYSSLSPFAGTIQSDPARLARTAIGVSLSRTRALASYMMNMTTHQQNDDPRAAAAIQDCFSNLGDALDDMHGSLKQLRQLVSTGSAESFRFQMSNVQTWMSAALTDEETCTDGFEGVAEGPLKADVCDRVAEVKKYTSNALALVNTYADKGMR